MSTTTEVNARLLALYVQLVNEPSRHVEIPGAGYSFGKLVAAQSAGDLRTLRSHGLPAKRVTLDGDPAGAIQALTERIKGRLGAG